MTFFGAIILGVVFGIVGGVASHFLNPKDTEKLDKAKKHRRLSPCDKDPFFGTPLESF